MIELHEARSVHELGGAVVELIEQVAGVSRQASAMRKEVAQCDVVQGVGRRQRGIRRKGPDWRIPRNNAAIDQCRDRSRRDELAHRRDLESRIRIDGGGFPAATHTVTCKDSSSRCAGHYDTRAGYCVVLKRFLYELIERKPVHVTCQGIFRTRGPRL